MSTEELITEIEEKMEQLKSDVREVSNKVEKIFVAILGSELTGDGGLVRRIERVEEKQTTFEKEFEAHKRERVKNDVLIKIMWTAAGAIIVAAIDYFIKK